MRAGNENRALAVTPKTIKYLPHLAKMGAVTAALLTMAGVTQASLVQEPIGVSGFNGDTIVDAAAATTVGTHSANGTISEGGQAVYTSSTNVPVETLSAAGYVHNGGTFFQNGWNSQTTGLPASGSLTSAYTNVAGGNTVFNFGYNGATEDYADNNCLYFTTSAAATLTLVTPVSAATLDFLATAELPKPYTAQTQFDVTLNFADGSSDTYAQGITTGPLGDDGATPKATNLALGNYSNVLWGTDDGNGNHTNNAFGGQAVLTESDITLTALDQTKLVKSITFTPDALNGTDAAIYAVSGQVVVPEPCSLGALTLVAGTLLIRRRRAVI